MSDYFTQNENIHDFESPMCPLSHPQPNLYSFHEQMEQQKQVAERTSIWNILGDKEEVTTKGDRPKTR